MSNRTLVAGLILVALVVGTVIYFKRGSSGTTLKPNEALGVVAAQQTAKLLGGSGQIIIVEPDFGGAVVPVYDVEMTSFKKELQKEGVQVAATEKIQLAAPQAPNKPRTVKFFEPVANKPAAAEPGQLGQLVSSNPQAKAVVYFVDLPNFNEADIAALKQSGAKVIAVSNWHPEYKELFQNQILQLAMVPRWEPFPGAGKKPHTMQDWFEHSYAMVTPDNAASVP